MDLCGLARPLDRGVSGRDPAVRGETGGIVAFGLAGLGCSASSLSASVSADMSSRDSPPRCPENWSLFIRRVTGWPPLESDQCEIFAGASFATIYFFGSLVAAAILIFAVIVVAGIPKARA